MITSINVNKISAHANNPRKYIDNLAELTESIRINGILQPLTVVPAGDNYKVVIGHRRLEAAKQAGLEEVPCEIKDMSDEQQLNVMMMENMMRENLTTYEEAKGFQLMLDLGRSVEQVAEQTGFSQSTIRNRTKLLGLNEKKFRDSVERGATLSDLMKLYDIEDDHTRNAVLTSAGTNNFESKLNQAIEAEKKEKYYMEGKAKIAEWATKVSAKADIPLPYRYYNSFSSWSSKIPEPNGGEYYYTEDSNRIAIYAKGEDTAEAEREARRAKEREEENELRYAAESCYKLRLAYVKNFGNFRKYGKLIMQAFIRAVAEDMARTSWRADCTPGIEAALDIKLNEPNKLDDFAPEKAALAMLFAYNDREDSKVWYDAWDGEKYVHKYQRNEKLEAWYDFLISIGYQMSDEETRYISGDISHVTKEAAA